MCSHEVSRKTDIFYRLGKKTKNMSQTGLILGTQFCLFYGDHTKVRFPIKQLGVHLQCGDARAGNYFGFFNILKYVYNTFQKKGAFALESQNTTSVEKHMQIERLPL